MAISEDMAETADALIARLHDVQRRAIIHMAERLYAAIVDYEQDTRTPIAALNMSRAISIADYYRENRK